MKMITFTADPEILAILAGIKATRYTRNTSQVLREAIRYYSHFLLKNTPERVKSESK